MTVKVTLATCVALAALASPGTCAAAGNAARWTTVPRLGGPGGGPSLDEAYRRAHRAGLRVSLPSAIEYDSTPELFAAGQSPAPGRRVRRGTVVTLVPSAIPAFLQVGALPPPARVPDFVGRRAGAVVTWASDHGGTWSIRLPALRAGRAGSVLGNYRVTRQFPRAGGIYVPVERVPEQGGFSDGFTPVLARARQIAHP